MFMAGRITAVCVMAARVSASNPSILHPPDPRNQPLFPSVFSGQSERSFQPGPAKIRANRSATSEQYMPERWISEQWMSEQWMSEQLLLVHIGAAQS